ncbi:aminoglycoside phosphotransferase family protein [Streptomyces sp. DSM 44917]|uniref:Aminoglycoside phosphotransferase family protein n=1 Tax=Streptomyces boetiae TaxID=3075541 RepID=A0ABU2L1M3_9ACTN|nr:aminoglycoside phosphotransferase family protein [Streptomyces sp. DSM 44917]MDT0305448.1 aminoglycoside phosphotransferase family protein [Streptomyces sp. DSM 44917]
MITVPAGLAAYHEQFNGEAGRAWTAALPALAERMLQRWELRPTGPGRHGMVALVLPVERADGSPAALKLQPVDEENESEAPALRAYAGRGAVRLLDHDPATGSLLLEALHPDRSLNDIPDVHAALGVLTGLLGRLAATPPPPGQRHLRDVAAAMLAQVPQALPQLSEGDRRVLDACAGATREVLPEPGGSLLHWDLHYENVLAPLPGSAREEPWLAIDPKPLTGDVGFDLLPALDNRFLADPADVLRRFDTMTDLLSLDRPRARNWTLARILQNTLWSIEDGDPPLPPDQLLIAETLLTRR